MRTWVSFFLLVQLITFSGMARPAEREVTYFPNKKIATERFYKKGQKVGVHKTWYPNGQLQSESQFEKPDQMKRYRDWFESGMLSKEIIFKDGLESETKIYRATGQIYLNRVFRNGRMYGLPGGKACARTKSGDL